MTKNVKMVTDEKQKGYGKIIQQDKPKTVEEQIVHLGKMLESKRQLLELMKLSGADRVDFEKGHNPNAVSFSESALLRKVRSSLKDSLEYAISRLEVDIENLRNNKNHLNVKPFDFKHSKIYKTKDDQDIQKLMKLMETVADLFADGLKNTKKFQRFLKRDDEYSKVLHEFCKEIDKYLRKGTIRKEDGLNYQIRSEFINAFQAYNAGNSDEFVEFFKYGPTVKILNFILSNEELLLGASERYKNYIPGPSYTQVERSEMCNKFTEILKGNLQTAKDNIENNALCKRQKLSI